MDQQRWAGRKTRPGTSGSARASKKTRPQSGQIYSKMRNHENNRKKRPTSAGGNELKLRGGPSQSRKLVERMAAMNNSLSEKVKRTRSTLRKRPSNTHFHRRSRELGHLSPVPSTELSDVSTVLKNDIWKETLGQYLHFQQICRASADKIVYQHANYTSPSPAHMVRSLRASYAAPYDPATETRRRSSARKKFSSGKKKKKRQRRPKEQAHTHEGIQGSNKYMTTNELIELQKRANRQETLQEIEAEMTSLDILDADDDDPIEGLNDTPIEGDGRRAGYDHPAAGRSLYKGRRLRTESSDDGRLETRINIEAGSGAEREPMERSLYRRRHDRSSDLTVVTKASSRGSNHRRPSSSPTNLSPTKRRQASPEPPKIKSRPSPSKKDHKKKRPASPARNASPSSPPKTKENRHASSPTKARRPATPPKKETRARRPSPPRKTKQTSNDRSKAAIVLQASVRRKHSYLRVRRMKESQKSPPSKANPFLSSGITEIMSSMAMVDAASQRMKQRQAQIARKKADEAALLESRAREKEKKKKKEIKASKKAPRAPAKKAEIATPEKSIVPYSDEAANQYKELRSVMSSLSELDSLLMNRIGSKRSDWTTSKSSQLLAIDEDARAANLRAQLEEAIQLRKEEKKLSRYYGNGQRIVRIQSFVRGRSARKAFSGLLKSSIARRKEWDEWHKARELWAAKYVQYYWRQYKEWKRHKEEGGAADDDDDDTRHLMSPWEIQTKATVIQKLFRGYCARQDAWEQEQERAQQRTQHDAGANGNGSPAGAQDDDGMWQAHLDSAGETYYYNTVTGETRWTLPEIGVDAVKQQSSAVSPTTVSPEVPKLNMDKVEKVKKKDRANRTLDKTVKFMEHLDRVSTIKNAMKDLEMSGHVPCSTLSQTDIDNTIGSTVHVVRSNGTVHEALLLGRAKSKLRCQRGDGKVFLKKPRYIWILKYAGIDYVRQRIVEQADAAMVEEKGEEEEHRGTENEERWVLVHDEEGKPYYYNSLTQVSSWEVPNESLVYEQAEDPLASPSPVRPYVIPQISPMAGAGDDPWAMDHPSMNATVGDSSHIFFAPTEVEAQENELATVMF